MLNKLNLLGAKAQEYIDAGKPVPKEIADALVESQMIIAGMDVNTKPILENLSELGEKCTKAVEDKPADAKRIADSIFPSGSILNFIIESYVNIGNWFNGLGDKVEKTVTDNPTNSKVTADALLNNARVVDAIEANKVPIIAQFSGLGRETETATQNNPSDPKVIAELRSIEAKAKIESQMIGYDRQKEIIATIRSNVAEINSHFDNAKETIQPYRDFKATNNKLADAQTLVKIINDLYKNQKDKEGRKMVPQWERDTSRRPYDSQEEYQQKVEKINKANYSPLDEFSKPYWFSDFALAVRDLARLENDFIKQNDINFSLEDTSSLAKFLNRVDDSVKVAQEQKVYFDNKEYKEQIEKDEIERREREQITYRSIQDNVIAFSRLNYLLSDKKVKPGTAVKYTSCPPMDDKGNRLTDLEALAHMDTCIAAAGQTKDLYFDKETGAYTMQRQSVHNQIIDSLFEGVKCVTKGQPIAVFTGGSPASGKTTYLNKIAPYLITPDVFKLDADAIRAMLPEYQGWNANATHKETQDIVNQLLQNIGDGSCRYDFIYDGTMNKAQKYFSLIKQVKDLGYKTFIIFLDIPYGIARKRALERYQKTGRYVPLEVIDDFFKVIPDHNGLTMGQYALNELKTVVDGYIVIDGITGQIIAKGGEEMPESRIYSNQAAKEAGKKLVDEKKPDAFESVEIKAVIPKDNDKQEILNTIAGLQILAKMGDKEAKDTIAGLKILLQD